jgi:hypothetical protein
VGIVVNDPSDAPGTVASGQGLDIVGGVPFDSGALTAPAAESNILGVTFIYTGDSESAVITLHALANDDTDQCRIAGVLTPGITPPA